MPWERVGIKLSFKFAIQFSVLMGVDFGPFRLGEVNKEQATAHPSLWKTYKQWNNLIQTHQKGSK